MTPVERTARLHRVFGDPLPATTSDERGPDEADDGDGSARDRWLRNERPPHHDPAD